MQLHWSHIAMFTRCPEQYRRRYILGEKLLPGVALITGKGVHKGIETSLKVKMDTGILPPVEQVAEAARDEVSTNFNDDIFMSEEEKEKGKDAIKGIVIDEAVKCAIKHREILAPEVEPIDVEREWVVNIKGFPVSLAGTIDCDEGSTIEDWKTCSPKQPPKQESVDLNYQMTMYCMAKKILDGCIPKVRMGYIIKKKEPEALFINTSRTEEDFKPLLRQIERISIAIDKECFPFASTCNPRPWQCSPKYCGYYNTCEGVSHRVIENGGI